MNTKLDNIRKEIAETTAKLAECNKREHMGCDLFDVMTHMFDLLREEEALLKQLKLL